MFYKKKLTIPARLWQIYIKIITIIINSLGIQRYVTTKTNKPKEFLLPRPWLPFMQRENKSTQNGQGLMLL